MLQPNQMENEHEVAVTKLQIHHCTLYESSPIHEFLTSSTQKWVRQPSLQCCSKTTGLHSCRASIQAPANEQKICMSRFITSFSRHHNSVVEITTHHTDTINWVYCHSLLYSRTTSQSLVTNAEKKRQKLHTIMVRVPTLYQLVFHLMKAFCCRFCLKVA